jgi:hypothetical protein
MLKQTQITHHQSITRTREALFELRLFVTATATPRSPGAGPTPHFLRSIRDGLTGAAESLQG